MARSFKAVATSMTPPRWWAGRRSDLGQKVDIVVHGTGGGRDRQAIEDAVDDRGLEEGLDEASLHLVADTRIQRLGDVVGDIVDEPARADDGDVGSGAAGDVRRQPLLEIVPSSRSRSGP
jgi:hypothetical protein